jgi:hypothetical protein
MALKHYQILEITLEIPALTPLINRGKLIDSKTTRTKDSGSAAPLRTKTRLSLKLT